MLRRIKNRINQGRHVRLNNEDESKNVVEEVQPEPEEIVNPVLEEKVEIFPTLISLEEALRAAGPENNREIVQVYIAQYRHEPWRLDNSEFVLTGGDKHGHRTLLMQAASYNRTDIMSDLLNAHADIDGVNDSLLGESAIHIAAENNQLAALALLLERGADINKQHFTGCTALHIAAFNGNLEAVSILLSHAANPLLLDEVEKTPAYYARSKNHPELVTLLKKAEIEYTRKLKRSEQLKKLQENPQTVIDEAIQRKNDGDHKTLWELAEFLYEMHTDANAKNEACIVNINTKQLFQCYQSIPENSPYFHDANYRLAELMYSNKNEGLEEKKIELQTRFRFAQQGHAPEIMTQTFHELRDKPGASEVEITGDIAQLYILMAEMMKKMDKQEHINAQLQSEVAQLKSEKLDLQKKVEMLENKNNSPFRHSQSRDILLAAPLPTNETENFNQQEYLARQSLN